MPDNKFQDKLRAARWNEDLHRFIFNGTRILLDVNSGSIHLLDYITWNVLDILEQEGGCVEKTLAVLDKMGQRVPGEEVLSELETLFREGLFLAEDEFAGQGFTGDVILKSLCLHVSHDCNMRCRYCFAGSGHFGGPRSLMPAEVGKMAIDFLLERSGPSRHCEIDFFGGEPLLNFPVVRELVDYGLHQAARRGKSIRFTLTTNGILLNQEVQEFVNAHRMNVVLSLDGRREVHDRARPLAGGQGSYDRILPNLLKFVASRGHQNYYVRGTYTGWNKDFSRDVLHMADLGFKILSVEPVVAPPETEYALKEDDLPELFEQYEQLTRVYLERKRQGNPFQFFHFNLDLQKGPCLPKRLTGCGAGYQYLAVTPEGELYPCHQFVGQKEFLMGNVEQGVTNHRLADAFRESHIYNKECRSCWARFYCSGGCHANAVNHNGDLGKPYALGCELQKKRLECAIFIQIQQLQEGEL